MDVVKIIPRALASQDEELSIKNVQPEVQTAAAGILQTTVLSETSSSTPTHDGSKGIALKRTTLDFSFSIPSINLELLDVNAVSKSTLQGNSIAKFRMSTAAVTYKTSSDGAVESEISLRSITMSNTRRGPSIFREIIPAANHDGNQL